MTLEQIRAEINKRGGQIKALALRWETVERVVAELGVKGTRRSPLEFSTIPLGVTVFEIPVVVVFDTQPEGVIL